MGSPFEVSKQIEPSGRAKHRGSEDEGGSPPKELETSRMSYLLLQNRRPHNLAAENSHSSHSFYGQESGFN